MRNHLIPGNWNALCDSCGRKFKAMDLKRRWDGLMVCKEDYELRHESDFLRVQKEKITVEFSRPYPATDTFIGNYCSIYEIQAKADQATSDCAKADYVLPLGTEQEEQLYMQEDLYNALADMGRADFAKADRGISLSPTY